MSKTYTICTVIRSIKIEYLEAKDSKKFTETFERYESLETCLKWAFYMKHCAALTPHCTAGTAPSCWQSPEWNG